MDGPVTSKLVHRRENVPATPLLVFVFFEVYQFHYSDLLGGQVMNGLGVDSHDDSILKKLWLHFSLNCKLAPHERMLAASLHLRSRCRALCRAAVCHVGFQQRRWQFLPGIVTFFTFPPPRVFRQQIKMCTPWSRHMSNVRNLNVSGSASRVVTGCFYRQLYGYSCAHVHCCVFHPSTLY